MSKQLIILVHGMGTHKKGEIVKEFKKAIGDRAKTFGKTDLSFLKDVDYKEFNYSEYFDLVRKQFSDNAQARKKGFKYLVGKGFEEKLLNQLTNFETKFGKDEFFYTHWLDVILYSTMYFGEKVRIDFISFFEKLRKKYDHKNMHVVCHSLGNAVVHDALSKYYRKDSDPFDNIPDLKTGNFNIASVWTAANVSRMVNLLNGLTDPYHSTFVTGADGCMSDFVNVRHKYDPFTWFKTYDREMSNGATFINTEIRKPNTHDFYEYMSEPHVARAVLNYLYAQDVSDVEFSQGVEEYKSGTLKQEVKELVDLLDQLMSDASIDSLKDAIQQYRAIQKVIGELAQDS